jgi:glycosyltransferase involved in cell wall biosynthesis
MQSTPLVSVAVHTYNHRAFIGQTIESILAQKRDFPIEIVISDDCSPDGTGKVIDEYQARYPDLFVRRDPERNVGAHANFARVWTACRGKYIALLDGDDWWHSPDKLSTQVELMEANPEYTISGHTVRVVQMPDCKEIGTQPGVKCRRQRSTIQDLIAENYLCSCSVMCRRGIVATIPTWIAELSLGDWPLYILHAIRGPIGFIDHPYGTYRLHVGGAWSKLDQDTRFQGCQHALRVIRANVPTNLFRDLSMTICKREIAYYSDRNQFDLARESLVRLKLSFPVVPETLKHELYWQFRCASHRHSWLSLNRFLWLMLAFRVYPTGFDPLRMMGKLGRRACHCLFG